MLASWAGERIAVWVLGGPREETGEMTSHCFSTTVRAPPHVPRPGFILNTEASSWPSHVCLYISSKFAFLCEEDLLALPRAAF